ncbi:PAS domain-containing protein [Candidatus Reidiella endopervernicosa]|uniref:PAS domain S-box protein n=1 Tax=Candidatus Reidiella endopervernicosa TaxID=2738883 RepID=A0A6N0HU65_9GAMM|nr:PAS domain-containing protein [Candidatus Reidiella endopervernicosa]QKQ25948.1 PAS domain S-box protein [Candidatus Reidiella endopervernicosa]
MHAVDGSLIDVNQMVVDNYGYTREELLKLEVEDFSADGYTNAQAGEYMMKALNGVPQDFEWLVRRKDGSTFDAEVVCDALKMSHLKVPRLLRWCAISQCRNVMRWRLPRVVIT